MKAFSYIENKCVFIFIKRKVQIFWEKCMPIVWFFILLFSKFVKVSTVWTFLIHLDFYQWNAHSATCSVAHCPDVAIRLESKKVWNWRRNCLLSKKKEVEFHVNCWLCSFSINVFLFRRYWSKVLTVAGEALSSIPITLPPAGTFRPRLSSS